MNNQQEVSIDVDMLDRVPAKTMLRLVEKSQDAKKFAALFHQTVKQLAPLFRQLETLDVDLAFSFNDGDIHLMFTGDGERLKAIWIELRRNGFKPSSHPEKGATSFYGFWEQPGYSRLFMQFSSSICRRVQVGTRMVEQPVYETRCEELPALESLEAAAPTLALADGGGDDMPF